jgi:hypothetical protein
MLLFALHSRRCDTEHTGGYAYRALGYVTRLSSKEGGGMTTSSADYRGRVAGSPPGVDRRASEAEGYPARRVRRGHGPGRRFRVG